MNYYTKKYLREITQYDLKSTSYARLINEGKESRSFDIFLSHSYADKEFIKGLFIELTNKGYSVYVDWIIDPQFSRTQVTKDTVNKIRERMKQSKSLIYATSENASTSKWMPWELGYMDGEKGKCAILPILETESETFKGQEFLSVYPIVSKGFLNSSDLNIQNKSNLSEKMKNWI